MRFATAFAILAALAECTIARPTTKEGKNAVSAAAMRVGPHGRPEPHAPAPRFLESLYAEVSARGIEVNGDKVADSLISAAGKPSCVSSALGAYTTGAGAKVMPGDDKDGTDGLLSTHAGPLDAHLVQVPGDESSIVSAQAMGNKGAVSGPSELIDPLNKNANVGKLGNGDIGPDLNKPQHDIAKDLKNPNSAVQQLEKCVGCDAAGMLGKIPPAIQSAASSIHLASANSTPQASQSASQSASPTPAPTSQASVSAVENVSPDLDVASGSKQPASHPVDGVANKAGNVMHGAPSALAVPASLLNKAGPSIGLSTGSASASVSAPSLPASVPMPSVDKLVPALFPISSMPANTVPCQTSSGTMTPRTAEACIKSSLLGSKPDGTTQCPNSMQGDINVLSDSTGHVVMNGQGITGSMASGMTMRDLAGADTDRYVKLCMSASAI